MEERSPIELLVLNEAESIWESFIEWFKPILCDAMDNMLVWKMLDRQTIFKR